MSNVAEEKRMNVNDNPDVLAYRVGQLEKVVTEGLQAVNTKLDTYTAVFLTKVEAEQIQHTATTEHKRIEDKIDATRTDLEDDVKTIRTEIKSMKTNRWVQNTLSAILGVILTLLVSYAFKDIIGG